MKRPKKEIKKKGLRHHSKLLTLFTSKIVLILVAFFIGLSIGSLIKNTIVALIVAFLIALLIYMMSLLHFLDKINLN